MSIVSTSSGKENSEDKTKDPRTGIPYTVYDDFVHHYRDKPCTECNTPLRLIHKFKFTSDFYPIYHCQHCHLPFPTNLNLLIEASKQFNSNSKKKRPNPPSPATSDSDTSDPSAYTTTTQLRTLILSLQNQIHHLTEIINKLSPLQDNVKHLSDRLDIVEKQHYSTLFPNQNSPHTTTPNPRTASKPTYVDIAKRTPKTKPQKPKASTAKVTFQPPPPNPKTYKFIYLPSRHKISRLDVSRRIRALGINSSRLLSITFPARHTVGILVHEDYSQHILSQLQHHHISPIEYDPTDPTALSDPKYATFSDDERRLQAHQIHKNRLLRILQYVRPHQYWPLANAMVAQDWITPEDLQSISSDKKDETMDG